MILKAGRGAHWAFVCGADRPEWQSLLVVRAPLCKQNHSITIQLRALQLEIPLDVFIYYPDAFRCPIGVGSNLSRCQIRPGYRSLARNPNWVRTSNGGKLIQLFLR